MKLSRKQLAALAAAPFTAALSGPALAQIKIGFDTPLTEPMAADAK